MGSYIAEMIAAKKLVEWPILALPGVVGVGIGMLEELRVSLFAQSLGTAAPVTAKRFRTAMPAVGR